MKGKKTVLERLDLWDEPAPRQPIVEICGTGRVIVENHGCILEYSRQRICIAVKYGRVCVLGENMVLRRICGEQLVISGDIQGVLLERQG